MMENEDKAASRPDYGKFREYPPGHKSCRFRRFRRRTRKSKFDKLSPSFKIAPGSLTQTQIMAAKTAEKSGDKTVETKETKTAEDGKIAAARQRELEAAISSITKAYGEGSIMRLGDARALKQIEVIPTGALAVDLALGVGGLPRGRSPSPTAAKRPYRSVKPWRVPMPWT